MSLQAPKYGWARVLIIIIPYMLFVGIFEAIGMLATGVSLTDMETLRNATLSQRAISHLFSCIGILLFLWGAMRILDKKSFTDLGFYLKKRGKDIIIGIFSGLIIMAIGYEIISISGELSLKEYIFNFPDLFWSILLFVCVAITEEALTRGYILRNFMQSMNKFLALILTSAIFAIMHGFNPNMDWFSLLSLFIAGLTLGIAYIYTKNLWFPIAYHFSWNLFQSLFGFNVSGQDFYSFIEFSIPTPNLFNGGAFGFEGSYLSLIADFLIIIGVVWIYTKRKNA